MELWDEMERTGDMDGAGDEALDEEPVRLPRDRQRRYVTFFTALTMVIAAASCILVVVLLRTQQASTAASDARDAALQDQLTAIEASLGNIDQSVLDSDAAAAGTAASYAALGSTVDSLRTNLTDYRDNNDIQNEEISEHLDSVIAQLDQIEEDMTAAQEESTAQGDVLGTRLDSITQESAAGNSNLTEELENVHSSITALIDKADNAQDGNYKELKGILTATDSSLSALVRDKFDETGALITSNITTLRGSVDSVGKNVQGISSSVSSGLSEVRGSLETVNTDLANMSTSLAAVDTNLTGVGTQVTGLSDRMALVDADLANVAASLVDVWASLDDLSGERLGSVEQSIRDEIGEVQTEITSLRKAISGGTGGDEEEITLADLSEALAALQEQTETLDIKIGRILQYHGIADPTGESGGDGGDGGDASGSGGETDAGDVQPPEASGEDPVELTQVVTEQTVLYGKERGEENLS